MSGRQGTCINCNKFTEGIYTIDCCRGWRDDKYNFHVEICEKCLDRITKNWKLGEMSADEVYLSARAGMEIK